MRPVGNSITRWKISSAVTRHVLDSRKVAGQLWLRVAVMGRKTSDRDEEPKLVASGWVPAHDREGDPVVWFATRD